MEPNDRKNNDQPIQANSTPDPIQILGFAGSLRQGSYNRALIRTAQGLAPDDMRVEHFELDDIPMYNHDVEEQGDPEPVAAFKRAIDAADAVLIATPGRLGTARAQAELRKVLVYNEMPVLARPSLLMRSAHDKFDDDLNLTDEPSRERLRELLRHFAAWIRFTHGWSPPED